VKERTVAEDLLHDGFVTIFTKVGEYRGEGSFEGWCKRIFVNTALGFLRRQGGVAQMERIEHVADLDDGGADVLERLSGYELLEVMDALPEGYRTILNLYAVEGYSHKEIGTMLGISENTSRSQYFRARGRLQEILNERQ
jgi:RNA polymerase sigma-70 factor (ECF subfamily)